MKIDLKLWGFFLFILLLIMIYKIWIMKYNQHSVEEGFKNKKPKIKVSKKVQKDFQKVGKDIQKVVKKDDSKKKVSSSPPPASSPSLVSQDAFATQNLGSLESCDVPVDGWNGTPEEIEKQKEGLTKKQECQIRNMMKTLVRQNVMESLSAQNPLMTGPAGPIGPPGPAGSKYIAAGNLVNQKGSFAETDTQFVNPTRVVSRSSGTNPTSSLVFLDRSSPFVSYQNWQYNEKNQIQNRYDNTCLTYQKGQDKLYMDTCSDQNSKQKWFWDKSNRLISLDSTDLPKDKIRCIGITEPEIDPLAASVPDCKGKECDKNQKMQYLIIKDCGPNVVKSDEIFGFH